MEDLGHIIHDIMNQLEECKARLGTDLQKVSQMSFTLIEPWYFIFHRDADLIINGQDVHHELTDAVAQWDNQHFYEFGHSIGLALSKITIGAKMANGIQGALPSSMNGVGSTRFQNDISMNGVGSTRFMNGMNSNGVGSTRFMNSLD